LPDEEAFQVVEVAHGLGMLGNSVVFDRWMLLHELLQDDLKESIAQLAIVVEPVGELLRHTLGRPLRVLLFDLSEGTGPVRARRVCRFFRSFGPTWYASTATLA
jgi:hypothetical protein